MTKYVFAEKFYGLVFIEIISDLPRASVNALYSIWEGRRGVGSFSSFLQAQKPEAVVIDLAEISSELMKVG